MRASVALCVLSLLMSGAGCDVTTEVTKIPFELTSTVVRPTSEFTSSTTPGETTFTQAQARAQLERIVAYAYEDVCADSARGHGEYLASLANLAGVPVALQTAFQADMQRHYAMMFEAGSSSTKVAVQVLDRAWSAGYGHEHTRQ